MSDLEQRLAGELGGLDVAPPDVDVAALERLGRRERTRRRGLVAAAVAVVVAATGGVAIAVGAGKQGREFVPAPPGPSETVAPVSAGAFPWWHSGVLHVGDTEVSVRYVGDVTYAGGVTLATVERSRDHWELVLFHDGAAELIAEREYEFVPFQAVLSADGSTVAWSEWVDDATRRITVRAVDDGEVLGTRTEKVQAAGGDGSGDVWLASVDAEGRVVYSVWETFAWRPDSEPVEVTGIRTQPAQGRQAWPGGLMFQGRGEGTFDVPGVYGTIDDDGRFSEKGRVEVDQSGAWSTDGGVFAWPGDATGTAVKADTDRLWVEGPDRERAEIPLDDALLGIVGWEDATHVVVATGTRRDLTVSTCDVVEATCATVENGPPPAAQLPLE